MLLHLTCGCEVITLPNESIIALFHHFFLQFRHIVEIDQKAHNNTTSSPPVLCLLQILITFNLYSGRPRVGLSVNNKQKIRQAMVKISRGGRGGNNPSPLSPLGQICQPKWLDHRRVNLVNYSNRYSKISVAVRLIKVCSKPLETKSRKGCKLSNVQSNNIPY